MRYRIKNSVRKMKKMAKGTGTIRSNIHAVGCS